MSQAPCSGQKSAPAFAPEGARLVVLAAGKGTRMRGVLSVPKPLAPVGGTPLLHRTMRQFHEVGFLDQCVATGYRAAEVGEAARACFPGTRLTHDPLFAEHGNLFSLLPTLRALEPGQGLLAVRGDALLTDASVLAVARLASRGDSLCVACAPVAPGRAGLASRRESLGVLYIAPRHASAYLELAEAHAARAPRARFTDPWRERPHALAARFLDLGREGGATFGTPEEYELALRLVGADRALAANVTLVDVETLRHIEDFDPERALWLARKIRAEGLWTAPLAVSREHHLVMDGQHRMEAARHLGLRRVPATIHDYADIPVHSLRPGFTVTAEAILARALSGDPYPYKTAKHVLPPGAVCRVSLADLL